MNNFQKEFCAVAFLISAIFFGQESGEAQFNYPPKEFVYVHKAIPDVDYEIRYAGDNNFIGEPIDGYQPAVAQLSTEAAEALKKVQKDVKKQGYRLKVFDAYRPQRAVYHY